VGAFLTGLLFEAGKFGLDCILEKRNRVVIRNEELEPRLPFHSSSLGINEPSR